MNYETVILKEKKIVGLSARTGNNKSDMQIVIGSLWQRFFAENIFQQIQNKAAQTTIGLYSDYSNNFQEYDITVGCEVDGICDIPREMIKKVIPESKYAKFFIKSDDCITAVAELWSQICQMPLDRTFTGDFEEYISENEVNIYIAIK